MKNGKTPGKNWPETMIKNKIDIMKKSGYNLGLVFLILLLFNPKELYSQDINLLNGVVGNGGSPTKGTDYVMNSTLGQTFQGIMINTTYRNDIGFWYINNNLPTSTQYLHIADKTAEFILQQNYPNPFHNSSTIELKFPAGSGISGKGQDMVLDIYNALGQKIDIAKFSRISLNVYRVRLNAENYDTGVYYYRLQNGNSSVSRRMIVNK